MKLRRLILSPLLALAILPTTATIASAYDGTSAAQYADQFALKPNPAYRYYNSGGNSDCANYVSQAFRAGGMRTNSSWTFYNSAWNQVIYNWYYFRQRSSNYVKWTASQAGAYTPSWHTKGDPVYYDWENDGTIDHVSMNVFIGTDQNSPGWNGNLVDAHSNSRYHAIWNLKPYNSKWNVTSFSLIHIPSSAT